MRALSGMPISLPSRLYAQLWYGHVIDEPQLPAGSNGSPRRPVAAVVEEALDLAVGRADDEHRLGADACR